MENINIHFVSLDPELPTYMKKYFTIFPNISFEVINIENCSNFDCIVSPGNSFGQMDGGIDAMLSKILSNNIGKKVRKAIAKKYFGEQPIGTCLLIKTGNKKYPLLAHSPTMLIPKNVDGTLNPYFAFKAVLSTILNYNKRNTKKIKNILTTTFCTGCGDISLKKSLKQMRYAYDVVSYGINPDWDSANEHYLYLQDLK